MDGLMGKVIKSYEMGDLIGLGSFGAVYRARQAVVDREVAVKIIYPAFANHPNFVRRFEAEAQMIASLEHPYIVPLYDYWRDPDGAYLVMRWLRGGHLRDALFERQWTLKDTARLVNQICNALAMAHRAGIVHRDLKPENILLDEQGNAYLADFGIAEILSGAKSNADEEFGSMGSPAYAAPEQMEGKDTTPQFDIYSIGVVIFEVMTGTHPFPELERLSQTELLDMRMSTALPSMRTIRPEIPVDLDRIIQRATALDPAVRYADVQAFAENFQEAVSDSGARVTSVIPIDRDIPNPYKGLRAFQEADANNFFGRTNLVHRLLQRLKSSDELSRFLAVVGPSGSGKSSVVKAGLIPALRRGSLPGSTDWYYVDMVPSSTPFEELESVLTSIATKTPDNLLQKLKDDENGLLNAVKEILAGDSDSEIFLFIDQFEEVFTLVENEKVTNSFIENLHTVVNAPNSRLRLVVTLRADFYDRPLLRPEMSELMQKSTEVVVPLNKDELAEAIIEPAKHVGVSWDSGLIGTIISEVIEQPGALPLLQYALSEMFERRVGNTITNEAYQAIGGVRGALARRADEIFNEMNEQEREATRQLFLRLITLGEGTEDTRRRAMLAEVTSAAKDTQIANTVIDKLGKSRLITFDRDPITRNPTLEVTHEAIIREWKRLRSWLDESREDVRQERVLANIAEEWVEANKDQSFLLQGSRLRQFSRWAESTNLALTGIEKDYLDASVSEYKRKEEAEQARIARERQLEQRAVNNLRLLVGVLLAAFAIAIGLSIFALNQSRIAQDERDRAEASAFESRSLALQASARQALSDGDTDLALVLALEANEIDNDVSAQQTLIEVVQAAGTETLFTGHLAEVTGVAFSPDGTTAASSSWDATVKIWNTETGETLQTIEGHSGDVESIAFHPNGQYILSGAADFYAILWDINTGEEIRRFGLHGGPVRAVTFSPDGQFALTGSRDFTVTLWDINSGEKLNTFEGHGAAVRSVDFSPDGRFALSGGRDAIIWSLETGEIVNRLVTNSAVKSVAFSPDGQFVITGATNGALELWNAATGNLERQLLETGAEIESLAYHPNGQQIITGTVDGVIHVWDVNRGAELYQLIGHQDAVFGLSISPDGRFLISSSKDKTMRLWAIGNPGEIADLALHERRITKVGYINDQIISSSIDGNLKIWNPVTLEETVLMRTTNQPIRSTEVSPNGDNVLIGLQDGTIQLWNVAQQNLVQSFEGHSDAVLAIEFNSDGAQFVSGDQNNLLILWDIATGEEIRRFENPSNIFSIKIVDDTHVLTTTREGDLIEWDLATGSESRRLVGHEDVVYSISISPDGKYAASGDRSSLVIVWDLESGEILHRLAGHTQTVWSVAFSPSGNTLLSGSADLSLIVWDIESGQEFQRFETNSTTFSVTYNQTGDVAVTGADDGHLHLWRTFSLGEVNNWIQQTRYIPSPDCVQSEFYQLETYKAEGC